jgi:hypothetical protein
LPALSSLAVAGIRSGDNVATVGNNKSAVDVENSGELFRNGDLRPWSFPHPQLYY